MRPTTSGTVRVLSDPHDDAGLLLVERDTQNPISVRTSEAAAGLRPGYLAEVTVEWDEETARVVEATVEAETRIEFVDDVTNLFEVARELCREARVEGDAIASETTYSTDGRPNGAVYAFAEQSGERDIWEEFRTGTLPLEPLVDRLSESAEPPHEVFVLRPVDEPFVVVYLVREKGSLLAETVRDTYDRPPE